MTSRPDRRQVLAAGLAGAAALCLPAIRTRAQTAPVWKARQFHNQPAQSHQHQFLVEMWRAVQDQTDGLLGVEVVAGNGGVAGSDPAVLDMLVAGEVQFFTLMGGIMGRVVPSMEIQGLPFAFQTHAEVHRAFDGRLGSYLRDECAAKGIVLMPYGLLENGFRQMCMASKPIRTVADMPGIRMRVPDGSMFRDFFTTLGAQPMTMNFPQLRAALAEGRVDGQENPLVVTEVNKLYEVTKVVSMTNHMWSGFNLIANKAFWEGLPSGVRGVVEGAVRTHIGRQRAYTQDLNSSLENKLARERGMTFNTVDREGFRRRLAGEHFYARWKSQLGNQAWALLEQDLGRRIA